MKEKGQGIVEFAIVLPFLIALSIAIIYLGALFMDYTQYSNAARDAARDISLQSGNDAAVANSRDGIASNLTSDNEKAMNDRSNQGKYAVPMTGLYTPTWKVVFYDANNTGKTTSTGATDVEVIIELTKQAQVGGLLADWGVLPDELKPIKFRMTLEKSMVVKTTN